MIQQIIYNLSIQLYVLIIRVLAPINKKAKLWVEGRKQFDFQLPFINDRLQTDSFEGNFSKFKKAWFHCASLGEFEQGRPVIEAFRKEYPNHKIVLTFFSPSGYEVRKNYIGADFILYLPADTPLNAKKLIDAIEPNVVFFVKYEFWRNYIAELKSRQIPIVSFSTIFRRNQIYFKPFGSFFKKILFDFDHIFVQNQESVNLLQRIGYQRFTLTGDTRFDRVKQIVADVKEIEIAKRFCLDDTQTPSKKNTKVFIIGSAWQEDIDCVFSKNNNQKTLRYKYIIAPHEIHEEQILAWKKQILMPSIRFSEVKNDTQLSDYQCLIIDNVGMLSAMYQYADFAFIGGGFGKGLHNILEAATFGMPIFFGNKTYTKFKEAIDLIEMGGAFAVENEYDFQEKSYSISEEKRLKIAKICRNYVLENTGATEKVMEWVRKKSL